MVVVAPLTAVEDRTAAAQWVAVVFDVGGGTLSLST